MNGQGAELVHGRGRAGRRIDRVLGVRHDGGLVQAQKGTFQQDSKERRDGRGGRCSRLLRARRSSSLVMSESDNGMD